MMGAADYWAMFVANLQAMCHDLAYYVATHPWAAAITVAMLVAGVAGFASELGVRDEVLEWHLETDPEYGVRIGHRKHH